MCRAVSSFPSEASTHAPLLMRKDTASAWFPSTPQCSAVLPPAQCTLPQRPTAGDVGCPCPCHQTLPSICNTIEENGYSHSTDTQQGQMERCLPPAQCVTCAGSRPLTHVIAYAACKCYASEPGCGTLSKLVRAALLHHSTTNAEVIHACHGAGKHVQAV